MCYPNAMHPKDITRLGMLIHAGANAIEQPKHLADSEVASILGPLALNSLAAISISHSLARRRRF